MSINTILLIQNASFLNQYIGDDDFVPIRKAYVDNDVDKLFFLIPGLRDTANIGHTDNVKTKRQKIREKWKSMLLTMEEANKDMTNGSPQQSREKIQNAQSQIDDVVVGKLKGTLPLINLAGIVDPDVKEIHRRVQALVGILGSMLAAIDAELKTGKNKTKVKRTIIPTIVPTIQPTITIPIAPRPEVAQPVLPIPTFVPQVLSPPPVRVPIVPVITQVRPIVYVPPVPPFVPVTIAPTNIPIVVATVPPPIVPSPVTNVPNSITVAPVVPPPIVPSPATNATPSPATNATPSPVTNIPIVPPTIVPSPVTNVPVVAATNINQSSLITSVSPAPTVKTKKKTKTKTKKAKGPNAIVAQSKETISIQRSDVIFAVVLLCLLSCCSVLVVFAFLPL